MTVDAIFSLDRKDVLCVFLFFENGLIVVDCVSGSLACVLVIVKRETQ